ncbi:IS1595 family transposase [Novosphingobium cyanobacteriorum]|uniref:IS1595 family transposase n=1 Tax=Novosphingobium cyanobacteriorum TaxID=3024215 RepID=A0ABT6CNQ2_9SPHN|nr:IS1595 family transposase [Novosphingobium cyanobacteriorum]MDF8335549.1 IS1595 family transposase [Novosphingobium cyanobacteriorum]
MFARITGKQNQLLDCLAKAWSVEQIAQLQNVQAASVRRRINNLCTRLECRESDLAGLYSAWLDGQAGERNLIRQLCRSFLLAGPTAQDNILEDQAAASPAQAIEGPRHACPGDLPVSPQIRTRVVQEPYENPRIAITPGSKGTSRKVLQRAFPDNDACLNHIFHARMAGDYRCFKCRQERRWYRIAGFRRYATACCASSFAPTGRTVMHRSSIPLTDWFEIMLLFANSKNGVTGHFIERHLGIAYKSGFRMADRIRTHMALLECDRKIGGPGKLVHIDEALLRGIRTNGVRGGGRAIVFGMCDETATIALAVPDRKAATLLPLIDRHVLPGSILVTDAYHSYSQLAARGWNHEIVNHSRGEWVNANGFGQASIEAYWGVFKRTIRGTHLHVSRANLWKYIGEFNFRYNRRHVPHEIFWDMIEHFPDFDRQAELRIDIPIGPPRPRKRRPPRTDGVPRKRASRIFRN